MSLIAKKPKKSGTLTEDDVDKLISKGGGVPERESAKSQTVARPEKKTAKIPVQLRLPQELIDRIDSLIATRVVKISRHAWFLEAIAQKIKNEQNE